MTSNSPNARRLAALLVLLSTGCSDCADLLRGDQERDVGESTDGGDADERGGSLAVEVCGAPTSTEPAAPFTRLDQLWVIDNSGSMCQEQLAIQRNFRGVLTPLLDAGVDLHVAITTTHAPGEDANYDQEPVAVEGHIQSTPQPLPGFDDVCLGNYDPVAREYTSLQPLRDALAVAVECMTTPDLTLLDVTDAQLNCALPDSQRQGCVAEVGGVDRDGDEVYTILDVFPDPSTYRAIPKILRSSDYADASGEPSDLTSICELSSRLRDNLSASKGRAVSDSEIIVASLHGTWQPFTGPMPDCKTGGTERPEVPFACNSDLGQASSGDRYERFIRQFPNYYPNTFTGGDPSARLDFENVKESGEMCLGELSSPLRAIGEQLAGLSAP